MDKGLIFTISILSVMGVLLFCFERTKTSAKEIAIISVLASFAALGRIPFAAIPSAQPTTFFIIISGYVFGCRAGFLVGVVATLVSNMFLGQGPWSIFQMFAWGFCGISSGLLGIYVPKANKTVFVIFGIFWGYLFGWIMNLWYWYSFVYPLNFKTWFLTNAASFWFDTIHAITNGLFLFILGSEFIQILTRFKKKLYYAREELSFETNNQRR